MMRLGFIVAVVAGALDQLSKFWILDLLGANPTVIEVTPFLNLVLGFNPGISFGFLPFDSPWIWSAFAIAVVIGLVVWLRRAEQGWLAVALGLVIGGAVGNVIDRWRIGAVVDFIDLHYAGFHWWTFNVADAAITAGVALLLVDALFLSGKSTKV